MQKKIYFILFVILTSLFSLFGVLSANAQAEPLTHRLVRGSRDATTNGEVSRVQRFLAQDRSVYPEATVSGYFGALTEMALKRWQVKMKIVSSGTPATTGYGAVGPKTRAVLNSALADAEQPFFGSSPDQVVITVPKNSNASGMNSIFINQTQNLSSVKYEIVGLPAGAQARLSTCTAIPCTLTNTVTINSTVPTGSYPITVRATSPTMPTSTTVYILAVISPGEFRYHLANSGTITLARPGTGLGNASASNTITATLDGGYAQNISFTQIGLPKGASASVTSCALTCSVSNLITINSTTPEGTYPITVSSSANGIVTTTNYTLVVTPYVPVQFFLSSSGNIKIDRPGSGTAAANNLITATLTAGISEPITFTQQGLPTGSGFTLASCSPNCAQQNTVTVTSATPPGTYSILVTGFTRTASSTVRYMVTVATGTGAAGAPLPPPPPAP